MASTVIVLLFVIIVAVAIIFLVRSSGSGAAAAVVGAAGIAGGAEYGDLYSHHRRHGRHGGADDILNAAKVAADSAAAAASTAVEIVKKAKTGELSGKAPTAGEFDEKIDAQTKILLDAARVVLTDQNDLDSLPSALDSPAAFDNLYDILKNAAIKTGDEQIVKVYNAATRFKTEVAAPMQPATRVQ